MTKIYLPSRGPKDWKQLLADPDEQWRKGFSAHAIAHAWERADGLPPEVAQVLGPKAKLLLAIPEHKVKMPGKGFHSQCDVFALVRVGQNTVAVAVEAKVNEPFGKTVGEWLVNASSNKIDRLTEICGLLGLSYPPPSDLRYQLFHRAAAAVKEARRFGTTSAAIVVHSFSAESRGFEDFDRFCRMFGCAAERNAGVTATLPDRMELILGWASGAS